MPEETTLTKKSPDMALTSQGFAPQTMEEAWSYATRLANTQFVPDTYRGKVDDCFIAIDISARLGVHVLMFLQNSYIVHGRPAMEAKLIQALTNNSGLFHDPLDYEVIGEDPDHQDYKVRAFASRKSTDTVLYGPWITWKLVKGENWNAKQGSKWKTMPEVMFHYRAASWFANRHCPEVKMGFLSTEEAEEIPDKKHVDSTTVTGVAGVKKALLGKAADNPEPAEEPKDEAEPAKDAAEYNLNTTDDDGGKEAPKGEKDADPTASDSPTQKDDPTSSPDSQPTHDKTEYVCKGCGGVNISMHNVKRGKPIPWCNDCVSGRKVVPVK